jgi:hypothetical protein
MEEACRHLYVTITPVSCHRRETAARRLGVTPRAKPIALRRGCLLSPAARGVAASRVFGLGRLHPRHGSSNAQERMACVVM